MQPSRLSYRSAETPKADRRDVWDSTLADLLGGPFLTEYPDGDIEAEIERRPLLDLHLVRIRQNTKSAGRSLRELSRSQEGRYSLVLQIEGRCEVVQQNASSLLEPGQMALLDGRRPFSLAYEGTNEHLTLRIPPELVERSFERDVAPLATVITSAAAAITAALMRSAYDHAPDCAECELPALRDALLGMALAASTARTAAPAPSSALHRISHYIHANANDPTLSPVQVAEACSVSVRQLHRLLASTGETMSSRLRRVRLNQCAADLRDPALAGSSVTEIAFRRGFNDSAHFSRIFKSAFGQSPRRYRQGDSEA